MAVFSALIKSHPDTFVIIKHPLFVAFMSDQRRGINAICSTKKKAAVQGVVGKVSVWSFHCITFTWLYSKSDSRPVALG